MNMRAEHFLTRGKLSLIAVSAMMTIASTVMAQTLKEGYNEFDGGPEISMDVSGIGGTGGSPAPKPGEAVAGITRASGVMVGLSFQGMTQFTVGAFGRGFIPPDTMGAVGKTQYVEALNGGFAVYDKTTGAMLLTKSDNAFWAAAATQPGSTGDTVTNGDPRIMFDKTSQKWIALSFGRSLGDIQIAVSTTADALGTWKSTKFTGFAGGIADYPTLAIDTDAVYIGTNNFNNCATGFCGTTLNVISRTDLFGATGPAALTAGGNVKQFTNAYTNSASDVEGGYAIQGVNSSTRSGMVMAVSEFSADIVRMNVTNPGTAGATLSAASYLGLNGYDGNGKARQPGEDNKVTHTASRVVDAGDDRIGSSVVEQNGMIYAVHTVTSTGKDHTEVRWVVSDAATGTVLQEGSIADPSYDYYQPSIAVNSAGKVVIGYNRSGFGPDGKITFMASTFFSWADGSIHGADAIVLHISDVDDYHNGSLFGSPAAGRQRWGDYSSVTIDPDNENSFFAIGEYAAEYNNAASGHPGGSGGSRWGTWISELDLTNQVPEPESLPLVFVGLLALGASLRRRQMKKG